MRQVAKFLPLLGPLMFLVVLARPATAQQVPPTSLATSSCKDMLAEYNYALNQVFPRGAGPTGVRPQDVDYTIVLRYLPSFQTESEIAIVKERGGTLDVTRYGLQDGDQSIWARLTKFYEKQSCPTDADFRAIKTIVKNLKPVPNEVNQLVASLFDHPISLVIDPNMKPGLTSKDHRFMMMDGETVYFWLDAFQDSAFFKLWGPWGGPTRFDSPLYDWADRLRKVVQEDK